MCFSRGNQLVILEFLCPKIRLQSEELLVRPPV